MFVRILRTDFKEKQGEKYCRIRYLRKMINNCLHFGTAYGILKVI